MKIEGMQYPLPIPPKGPRNGNSHSEPGLTEDAVYFEPEEGRKEEQKRESQEQPKEPLEGQIVAEQVESQEGQPDAAHTADKAKRPPLNITA